MWIRCQATARCVACSETTAVNAAISSLSCDGCGASLDVRAALWQSALDDVRSAIRELDANATTTQTYDADGMTLTIAATAVDARCPHCDKGWTKPPTDACEFCGTAVSVRGFGASTLVGEDRQLVAGEARAVIAQTISCSGCGAPLTADGSARKLTCASCTRETVLADELWRRLHAPTSVAPWWVFTSGKHQRGLKQQIFAMSMASGAGKIFVLGRYGDTPFSLLALDTDPLGVAWMMDVERHQGLNAIAFAGDAVFGSRMMSKLVEVFDAATGAHRKTLTAPETMTSVAADVDGTFLGRSVQGELFRFDAAGAKLPLFQGRSFFARLFSGGPARRLASSGGPMGVGHDGAIRAAQSGWLARFERNGALSWELEVKEGKQSMLPPAAASDGTTYAVYRTVGGSMTAEELLSVTEALVSGKGQNTSALVRASADGSRKEIVRRSGDEEFTCLAVTPAGEVWLGADNGQLLRLDAQGALLWQQRGW